MINLYTFAFIFSLIYLLQKIREKRFLIPLYYIYNKRRFTKSSTIDT